MEHTNPFANPVFDLAPDEVHRRLSTGSATLIDVREHYERDISHIPGSRHLEIDRVAWNAHTIDWSVPVIFHCRLGWRAAMVTQAFRAIGREAFNLDGGMVAWAELELPITPPGSTVSPH